MRWIACELQLKILRMPRMAQPGMTQTSSFAKKVRDFGRLKFGRFDSEIKKKRALFVIIFSEDNWTHERCVKSYDRERRRAKALNLFISELLILRFFAIGVCAFRL